MNSFQKSDIKNLTRYSSLIRTAFSLDDIVSTLNYSAGEYRSQRNSTEVLKYKPDLNPLDGLERKKTKALLVHTAAHT